ncbi:hypothetical protein CDAR_524511 [Caerostris darwini]|uniref:Uncharacterized protein n=1 Tax=Caerostris darwini TaxID=1538125 RepID=A0AAV4VWH3_9ARAC|nr:hypothetical protein CDAR_524511 [Caerostris darwini]
MKINRLLPSLPWKPKIRSPFLCITPETNICHSFAICTHEPFVSLWIFCSNTNITNTTLNTQLPWPRACKVQWEELVRYVMKNTIMQNAVDSKRKRR